MASRHHVRTKIVIGAFSCSIVGLLIAIVMSWSMDGDAPPLHYMWLAVPLILYGLGVGAVNTCNQALSQKISRPASAVLPVP